jgi:hypothetical protein
MIRCLHSAKDYGLSFWGKYSTLSSSVQE